MNKSSSRPRLLRLPFIPWCLSHPGSYNPGVDWLYPLFAKSTAKIPAIVDLAELPTLRMEAVGVDRWLLDRKGRGEQ